MFDSTAEFVYPARAGKSKVEISMRWPNDEEWAERHRKRKIVIRNIGRGISETDIDSGEADLKMYKAARVNGAPDLTAAEASLVIKLMERTEVTDVALNGEEGIVTMMVPGGQVTHRLQLPTADQVARMQKQAAHLLSAPHNTSQLRIFLEPTAKLWDECKGVSEDYIGTIPALHKDAAIRAVVEQINAEMSAGDDERLF
jgi:hypothetical protein